MGPVTSVKAISSTVVQFHTSQPVAVLPQGLSALAIVPPKAFTKEGPDKFFLHPVATGAWKIAQFIPNEKVVLERNPGSLEGTPKAKELTFTVIASDASRVSALQSGAVDLIDSVPTDQISIAKSAARWPIRASARRSTTQSTANCWLARSSTAWAPSQTSYPPRPSPDTAQVSLPTPTTRQRPRR